ncbi:hypothetical protein BDY19DRAFT_995594 [Irpex rosettiformis]|uniref:Uncharacterized protein n=1 Tax=Irpex rosettiformis TaxID=378272 RepID=A0ACB8TXS2_9APHY|nr:hypothetical protein BDY19DRAFT_995594 [Irpex rosettiformis]
MAARQIIGISLHVEGNGIEPAQVLTFLKDKTPTFTIGRKSTQARHSRASTSDTALFRCPVISRRHAQISFLENGTVFVKDMNSHHGTHILKPGQTISTPVPSDIPQPVEDGDTITFGKSVGREETYVRPMVAKVRMHYSSSASPSSLSSSAFTTPLSTISGPSSAQTITRRYGLVAPTALSDSSESDDESDVEELDVRGFGAGPVPSNSHFPLFSPVPQIGMNCPSGFGGWARVFASRVYPHPPQIPQIVEQEDAVEEEERPRSNRFSPIEVLSASPSRSPSVIEINAPSQSQPQSQGLTVLVGEWLSPSSSPEPQPAQDLPSPYDGSLPSPGSGFASPIVGECDFWQYDHFISEPPQNVAGPSTSSACPGPLNNRPSDVPNEPPSALLLRPAGDAESIYSFTDFPPSEQPVVVERESSPEDMQLSDDDDDEPQIEPAQIERVDEASVEHIEEAAQPVIAPEPTPVAEPELAQEGFETSVEQLKIAIAELDERMSRESPNDDPAQDPVDAVAQPPQSEAEVQPEAQEAPAVDREVDVQSIVEVAMNELRAEREALKARFAEAEELVNHARALALVQQENQAPSLKRKHNELASDDDELCKECHHARPIKRKRSLAMRVASGVAKTTAIAAVGAVATWSALAFS